MKKKLKEAFENLNDSEALKKHPESKTGAKIIAHPSAAKHAHSSSILPTSSEQVMELFYLLSKENQDLKQAYETLYKQTIHALLQCLEERDAYTYGHCMRVMEYATMIGRSAGFSSHKLKVLELSAMFHDIGKLGVPDCVLLKPGKLDPKEQEIIKQHSLKGSRIMSLIDAFQEIVPGVRHHHERIDGHGYPDELSGNEIPLISRVILVADTFDAMTSTRPYRKGLPVERAYSELERFAGAQFDNEFVQIFLKEHRKLTLRTAVKEAPAQPTKIKKAA